MRGAPAIELSSEARLELEKLARRRTTPVRVVQGSRIVLLTAGGMQNKQIAEQLGVEPRMAALWRCRFLQLGVAGLMKDALRPGRTPAIQPNRVAGVIARTAQTIPAEKEIYLIYGNYATHKHPCVQRWLLKHKRFHFCFTQT